MFVKRLDPRAPLGSNRSKLAWGHMQVPEPKIRWLWGPQNSSTPISKPNAAQGGRFFNRDDFPNPPPYMSGPDGMNIAIGSVRGGPLSAPARLHSLCEEALHRGAVCSTVPRSAFSRAWGSHTAACPTRAQWRWLQCSQRRGREGAEGTGHAAVGCNIARGRGADVTRMAYTSYVSFAAHIT